MKASRLMLLIALAALLGACGLKGDLVHPDTEKPAETTPAADKAAQ